jgi:hypothetical protein
MEKHRTIQVIRGWKDSDARIPSGPALLEVPGEWAHAVFSLVKISQEHRHNGLIVTNIGPGSQGARSGMIRGDVLLRYDGEELDSAATLRHLEKRHTQGGESSRKVRIDAARGLEDVSFEVLGGRLGITVSPLLHRLRIRRIFYLEPHGFEAKIVREQQAITVIQTQEDARKHDPGKHAVIEVPRELARKVLSLLKSLEASGTSELKKMARSLLTTVRA